jgi:hypothetical protein
MTRGRERVTLDHSNKNITALRIYKVEDKLKLHVHVGA